MVVVLLKKTWSRLNNYLLGPKQIGFLVENNVYSLIPRSIGLNLGQNIKNNIFI